MNGTYEFIRHDQVEAKLADGWTMASDLSGTHHGHWSVLMQAPALELKAEKPDGRKPEKYREQRHEDGSAS